MGGRSGLSTGKTGGGGGGGSAADIRKHLIKSSPEISAEIVMEVLSASSPAIAALYVAYKVVKFIYPIAKKGAEEYEKTGDKDRAVQKMAEETIKQTGKEIVKKTVEIAVKTSYSAVVKSNNLKTDKTIDTIVTAVVSKVTEKVIEGAKNE